MPYIRKNDEVSYYKGNPFHQRVSENIMLELHIVFFFSAVSIFYTRWQLFFLPAYVCSLAHRKRFSFTLIPLMLQQHKYSQTGTRTVILDVGHSQNSISKTAFQTLQDSLSQTAMFSFISFLVPTSL